MARRKSLNRRLSRYSRNSTGSAFLDPDTENLGDEQPYWWKNLENNTVMRPSMSSNTPNQTSPILDPNSRIDSGKPQDGWWKVLETTDIADDAKLTMPTTKPDADNNIVTTSESDEEPRIIKRKVTLRSAARKLRSDPFMNIVESEMSDKKSTDESPTNKSGSINKGTTRSRRVNKIPESSSDQSHSTDVILKSKPTLFKRKHKDRQRNVFDDVLKENELLTPKKRKSLILSPHSKTGTLMENKITKSPIVKQGRAGQLALSFENDHDLSRLPNPEAQSTLLESSSSMHGSNKDTNNSEMEARVLKPKSTFLKRLKRGGDKNVFADIFAEEETHNDVEISKGKEKGTDANAEASKNNSVGQEGGSFRGPQSTPSNVVNEIRTGDAKATKGSRSTETITSPAQDPRGSIEPNASAPASIASSDTSDKSQDHNTFLKPRSTFLTKSRKRSGRNIFQEILEEDDNVDALRQSGSDALIDRTKEDLRMKNQATGAPEKRRHEIIDQESNIGSDELHLELAGSSDEDIAWPDGNNAKETSKLCRSTYDSDIEFSELGSELKEKRQRRSALNVSPEIPEISNQRTASLPRIINEASISGGSGTLNVRPRESASDVSVSVTSKHEEGNRTKSPSRNQHERDILEENKGSSHKLYPPLSIDISDDIDQESEVIEGTRRKGTSKLGKPSFRSAIDDSESDDLQSTPSRPSKKLRTSIRQLTVVTPRDSDLEPVLSTPKRQSKSLSKSQKLLSSRVISEDEAEEVQTTSKTPSRSLSKSQKLLSSRVISEAEVEDVQATPKRQSKSLSKSQKWLSSRVVSEDEPGDVQATPKRQSKSLSKSQKRLSSRVVSEDEPEDVQETTKRQTRSLSKSQKLLSSRVISEDEVEEVQATLKRQSGGLSKSQKLLSSRVISEDEAEEVQTTPKRQSRSLSKSQKLLSSRVVSEDEPEEVQATSKRQSGGLSKSQKLLSSRVISEDEVEEVQATSKRQSGRLSKSQKLLSSRVISEAEVEDVQATPKRQSRSLSKSQKLLSSRVISEDEPEEVQTTPERQRRSSSRSQKWLSMRVVSESETEDVQETTKRQTRSLSKSQKLLSTRVMSEDEAEEVQTTSKTPSRSLSKSQKLLSSRVTSEDEAEEVQATSKTPSRSLSKSQKLLSSRVISEDEAEEVQTTPKTPSRSLSKSQKLLSSRVISEDEAEEVQTTSERQRRSSSRSQKWLSTRVTSEDEAEEIQRPRKTRESEIVNKAQKRSILNAITESEAEHPKTPERRSKVLSKSRNDTSSAANQIEPCEVDGGAKRQSKSISRVERQLTVSIVNISETKEVESSQQKHSRNFMSREPTVLPTRGDSQLTVPITGESNMHRVQEEEEEEEGGIDAGVESFSATRRSEQRIAFNPNVTKDREDEDLLNVSSKNVKEAKEVSRNDARQNVGENRSVTSGKAKGSVGSTRMSTKRGKDSLRGQRNIEDFLNVRKAVPASQVFDDTQKAEKFKRKLEEIKKRIMDDMTPSGNSNESKLPLQQKKPSNLMKTAKATQKRRPAKPIHKAFLVNGQVYKVPRLPRPQHWVTDRLYKYLWKRLEPKHTLQTRVISEKFVRQLSNVMRFIVKQKSYTSYRAELYALMKEMARLGIIRTRHEFYTFCHEFFPYELRVKVIPMLLPGNKRNIPYDMNKLHEPLLRS
ncbi:uncharacterized protein LOC143377449 isoform X5 [Andrena cerasifolii]|uniref:uncharacterized protein LOC143377449 isoform X5 n=1 Tax=Andrena cerasifolii TaxID=2819439 RepID=UPI0040377D48